MAHLPPGGQVGLRAQGATGEVAHQLALHLWVSRPTVVAAERPPGYLAGPRFERVGEQALAAGTPRPWDSLLLWSPRQQLCFLPEMGDLWSGYPVRWAEGE